MPAPHNIRLGVNIDHVATLRNVRGSPYPDILRAAKDAVKGGGDGITAHLREDRRHIRDADIEILAWQAGAPLNMEMAATEEMLAIALKTKPHAVCIVPEKRHELTTEGGLDAARGHNHLAPIVRQLSESGIRVSLFISAAPEQLAAAASLKAPVIELHTGAYAEACLLGDKAAIQKELALVQAAAKEAQRLNLECHAGHGLTFDNVAPIAAIENIMELNIGHVLVAEAVFTGLENAVREMKRRMLEARRT
ncbi:MAG TPA: pyridoxine 5'-phosphate synthase [Alphaproteobacteria bacterium]|nr:pyridoxine 5'-phosphate synthase [Alphaproteobacteria bacterium]